ncbi:unnamed protein product [Rotaria sp. Silwood1]|nr:unnamed protein product [Rotaria sp. Silwood1]
MNLLNIAKHLLYLAQTEYGSGNFATTIDEIFVAEQLFEVLKSFKDSYFSELYTYDTLEFDDEYEEMTDTEENDGDMDNYNENEHSSIQNQFTLEEMENIIEWVDQHPNASGLSFSPKTSLVDIVKAIVDLMDNPDLSHVLQPNIAAEYSQNRAEFDRKALEMVIKHGLPRQ